MNFLKLFKTDEYINGHSITDTICFKISLIRQVEKILKLEFMDEIFNSYQLNISLDVNLFDTIKKNSN